MKTTTRTDLAVRARVLVQGDGFPRAPAQLVAQVEAALVAAYEAGQREALPAARARALVEVRIAVEGARQGLAHSLQTIERELTDIGKQSG